MSTKEKEIATPELKVAEISKEIAKVEKDAKSILIKTQEDYENASKFLSSVIKPRANRINELVKFFTDPYVEARRVALANKQAVEEMFSKPVIAITAVENFIKTQMSSFLREQDAIAKKEEARLQAIRDKANEKREIKGVDPIMAPVQAVERADTTIKNVEGGKTIAKKVWKFEITDYTAIDDIVISEVLGIAKVEGIYDKVVRRKVNAGMRELSGVRIYEDFDISAKA